MTQTSALGGTAFSYYIYSIDHFTSVPPGEQIPIIVTEYITMFKKYILFVCVQLMASILISVKYEWRISMPVNVGL